jgi:hypothetical protein
MAKKDAEDAQFDASAPLKLQKVHDAIDRPDKFAEIFVKAAQNQVSVKDLFRTMIRETLNTDVQARDALKGIIKQVNKEDWRSFVRSAWGKVSLVIWTVVTLAIGYLFRKYIG